MKKWYKLCPYCWEEIKEIAKKCRFCGEFLEENVKNIEKEKAKIKKESIKATTQKKKIKKEKILTYEENGLWITIWDNIFENTSKNNLLFGAIMLVIVIIAYIKNWWPKSGEERAGLIIGLLIVWAYISIYISRKKTYFTFKNEWISAHIQKPLYTILPIFRDIQIKYEDIAWIGLKYTWWWSIFFIVLFVWGGSEYLGYIDSSVWLIVFLIEFVIFVLPFILRRKKYCRMVIQLHNWTEIRTSVVKWTKKEIFDVLEDYLKSLWINNIPLLYHI